MWDKSGMFGQRHPHVKLVGERERIKFWLSNADNREHRAIQTDRFTDGGRRAAKGRLPEAIIQDSDRRSLRSIVALKEQPPQVRANADRSKIIAGDKLALYHARWPVSAQIKLLVSAVGSHMGEDRVLLLSISKEGQRQGASVGVGTITVIFTFAKTPVAHGLGAVVCMPLQKDHVLRIRNGHPAKCHRINQAEDG